MDIQGRIRELMEERSWTEYRLAKEANLSHSTVANMFNRNNAPTFPTLEAICSAFQMTYRRRERTDFKMETVERRTEESVIGIDGCNIKPARCEC